MFGIIKLTGQLDLGPCGNGGVCLQASRWNHAAVTEPPEVGEAKNPCPGEECSECGCETNAKPVPQPAPQ